MAGTPDPPDADRPEPTPATAESKEELIAHRGSPVISSDGEKIGVVEEIFEDIHTGRTEWIGLGSGFLYAHRALVPLLDAVDDAEGTLTVKHAKDAVKDAPDVELIDGELISPQSEAELNAYYGLAAKDVIDGSPRLRLRRYLQEEPDDAGDDGAPGTEPA